MKKTLIAIIAAVGLVLSGASIANATPDTVEIWWLVPAGAELEPSDHPQGDGFRVDSDGFPQTLLAEGEQDLECGQLAQVDIYPADEAYQIIKDGVLHEGEDYDVIVSWRFVYGGECDVDVPEVPVNTVPDVPVVDVPESPTVPAEVQTAAPELAVTGAAHGWLFGSLGVGAVMLGLVLVAGAKMTRRTAEIQTAAE